MDVSTPRLKVSPRLREMMTYDKFAGPAPRLLIMESRYWLDDACSNAATQMGWEVQRAPVPSEGQIERDLIENLFTLLLMFKPDFILAVNHGGMDDQGIFAGLFADLNVPLVTWFVDDPRTILMVQDHITPEHSLAVTWEEAYEPYLRSIGYPVVATLPLAVDATLFNAEPLSETTLPPAFVGNSMESFAKREGGRLRELCDLLPCVENAFVEGRVTRKTFAQGLSAFLPEEAVAECDVHARRTAELYCFIEGTRRLRRDFVKAVVPLGACIHGDEEWKATVPDARPSVNYKKGLPAFYQQTTVNLNITSIQMATAVNQRVFDCPAAGGFLLTDAQDSLRDLFDVDNEIACYHSLAECVDLLTYYTRHPEARTPIIQKARQRGLNEHTYAHRLGAIVDILKANFTE